MLTASKVAALALFVGHLLLKSNACTASKLPVVKPEGQSTRRLPLQHKNL
jgi:hypothetical protein